jgi:primase-polymerase (primpol)-like protein
MLAHKHGCDAQKIDEQFRRSGLYRHKWDRADYRSNTIERAIAFVQQHPEEHHQDHPEQQSVKLDEKERRSK